MILGKSCTGCGACSLVCPQQCINMKEDKLGQIIPQIDTKKCIGCGLCELRCPQINPLKTNTPINCYAAWSNCSSDLVHSASGGVCSILARETLRIGGYFYGCDYDTEGNLNHFCAKSEDDIIRMQSSKYSRSIAYICYEEILNHLKSNHLVVFVGTPCQVSGLLKYLNKSYETLITIDLVCHGTPPNKYLKQHIKELGISFPVSKIRFRGEYDQCLTIWKNEVIVYKQENKKDIYFKSFYQNMISYDACYTCQYATSKRVSDITVGDFWGLGKLDCIKASSSRPSIILTNTEHGQRFFDKISFLLNFEKRSTKEGIAGNGRLNSSPGKNYAAIYFQKIYSTHLFSFHRTIALANLLKGISKKAKTIKRFMLRH